MCYEYDWMQEVNVTEETRRLAESVDKLTKDIESAPSKMAQPKQEEPVPA